MALSANATREVRTVEKQEFQIVNAAEVYAGGFMALCSVNHGTSASRGRMTPWTSAENQIPMGWAIDRATGNTSASPITRGLVDISSRIVQDFAVTGVSAQSDVGRLVYLSDDATLTLTRPTAGIPVGVVVNWISSTTCDVLIFGAAELAAIALGGSGQYTWPVGLVSGAAVATGNVLTGITIPHACILNSVYGIVVEAATGSALSVAINLEIDAVNVTGGVVTWTTASGVGVKLAGTAITALNVAHEGELLDIEATVTGAGTAGLLALYVEVQPILGV